MATVFPPNSAYQTFSQRKAGELDLKFVKQSLENVEGLKQVFHPNQKKNHNKNIGPSLKVDKKLVKVELDPIKINKEGTTGKVAQAKI